MGNDHTMFAYPAFSENGEKVLTTMDGLYKDMMMNITVYRMKAGEERTFHKEDEEVAVLLLCGKVQFCWLDQCETAVRTDSFAEDGACLHACKDHRITIKALEDSEILVQSTNNEREFAAKYYRPQDISEFISGEGLCGNTAVRRVTTIFDYHNAPYSNMVMGEVFNQQGSWSSYIPHHHPQPEVYYYRFDKPQGFGACFIGDKAFRITDGSFSAIPGGLTHPQVTAPGYRMNYVWMIRHFDGNPWTDRIDDPQHLWMLGQEF